MLLNGTARDGNVVFCSIYNCVRVTHYNSTFLLKVDVALGVWGRTTFLVKVVVALLYGKYHFLPSEITESVGRVRNYNISPCKNERL